MAKNNPMETYCDQAGCNEKQRRRHAWKWQNLRWHSHPLPTFCAWFEPDEVDPVSGASVGGHPDARRVWARKTASGWSRRRMGVNTIIAWNCATYVLQFDAWQSAGSPEPDAPFVSIAATLDVQQKFWAGLKPLIEAIGKPVPPAYADEHANPHA